AELLLEGVGHEAVGRVPGLVVGEGETPGLLGEGQSWQRYRRRSSSRCRGAKQERASCQHAGLLVDTNGWSKRSPRLDPGTAARQWPCRCGRHGAPIPGTGRGSGGVLSEGAGPYSGVQWGVAEKSP